MTVLALLALPLICTAQDFEMSARMGDEVAVIDILTPDQPGLSGGLRYMANYNTSSSDSSYVIRDHYFGPVVTFSLELCQVQPYVSGSILWETSSSNDLYATGEAGVGFGITDSISARVGYMWAKRDRLLGAEGMWLFGAAVRW